MKNSWSNKVSPSEKHKSKPIHSLLNFAPKALNEPAFVRPNWPCEQLPQCLLDADNYLQDIEDEVEKEAQEAAGEEGDALTCTVVHYLEKVQNFLDEQVDNAEEMKIISQASLL